MPKKVLNKIQKFWFCKSDPVFKTPNKSLKFAFFGYQKFTFNSWIYRQEIFLFAFYVSDYVPRKTQVQNLTSIVFWSVYSDVKSQFLIPEKFHVAVVTRKNRKTSDGLKISIFGIFLIWFHKASHNVLNII